MRRFQRAVIGSQPLDNESLVPETLILSSEADVIEYDAHDAFTSAEIQKTLGPGFHNLLGIRQTLFYALEKRRKPG